MISPTHNFGPIGSVVMTFIGYNQIEKQTSKVYIYKYIFRKGNPESNYV